MPFFFVFIASLPPIYPSPRPRIYIYIYTRTRQPPRPFNFSLVYSFLLVWSPPPARDLFRCLSVFAFAHKTQWEIPSPLAASSRCRRRARGLDGGKRLRGPPDRDFRRLPSRGSRTPNRTAGGSRRGDTVDGSGKKLYTHSVYETRIRNNHY